MNVTLIQPDAPTAITVRECAIVAVMNYFDIARNDAIAQLAEVDFVPLELEPCPDCRGYGFPAYAVFDFCTTCEGRGTI